MGKAWKNQGPRGNQVFFWQGKKITDFLGQPEKLWWVPEVVMPRGGKKENLKKINSAMTPSDCFGVFENPIPASTMISHLHTPASSAREIKFSISFRISGINCEYRVFSSECMFLKLPRICIRTGCVCVGGGVRAGGRKQSGEKAYIGCLGVFSERCPQAAPDYRSKAQNNVHLHNRRHFHHRVHWGGGGRAGYCRKLDFEPRNFSASNHVFGMNAFRYSKP